MFKNRRNKGFTLIELLAVIVVLSIIALISIPIITNVIEKAKKGAVKSSAYGLVEAGELYLANNLSKGISENIEFTCSGSKCIKDDKEIDYKGDIDSGTLKLYTDGKITLCIEKDSYGAYKLATEKEVTVEKGTCNDDYKVDAYMSKSEYDKIKDELDELKDKISKTDATQADVKEGKKALINNEVVTGTHKDTQKILLGSGTSYDIKTLYPNIDYTKLTVDNFLVVNTANSAAVSNIYAYYANYTKSYSNGILTIVAPRLYYAVTVDTGYNSYIPFNVYLIV